MAKWKDIPGYEKIAKISNVGLIKIYKREWTCGTGRICKSPERTIKGYINSHGYYQILLWKNGKYKSLKIHRLVAQAFIPNPDNKRTVNHKDGNKLNNNVWNLEWNTYSENSTHSYKIGLQTGKIGEQNGKHKLTYKQVIKIKRLKGNKSAKDTAYLFKISVPTIYKIWSGEIWKN